MPHTLTDTANAIERNTASYWRAVCRELPGAEFVNEADAAWFITGLPFFAFNQVLRASFSHDSAGAAIDERLAPFQARRVHCCWNVGPGSQPAALGDLLAARSPARTNSMPAMALDLSRPLAAAALPDGVAIERVRDAAALDRWARAYRDAFTLPPEFVAALRGVYAATGFDDSAPFRHYVALVDGEPVACSTMFVDEGVASLWHIGTLATSRRRGIGAAITTAPLADASALGCHTAALYASEMGMPLYQRLGFQERFRVAQYGWQFGEGPDL